MSHTKPMTGKAISFVIPTLNEETNLPQTIESINRYCPKEWQHEIIVVDHGSTDATRERALELGATVYQPAERTIAGLRNFGASHANGSILIFLDADVTLTEEWKKSSGSWLDTLLSGGNAISGSKVSVPSSTSFVLNNWFAPLAEQKTDANYLGTAHLIAPKVLFDSLGGFDNTLKTGEDYDFCRRATAAGIKLTPNPNLVCIHNRFPSTLLEFLRRERWHGEGDWQGVRRIVQSKVALATLAFLFAHLVTIVGLLYSSVPLTISGLTGIGLIIACSVWAKFSFRRSLRTFLNQCLLFYLYYLGRATAVFPTSQRWS
jgi:glycosyltransferase involved in cell wall biosynthesis